jgi:threonine synthase
MTMDHVLGLTCTICGETYAVDEVDYVCPKHGDEGILDVIYDYDLIAREIDPETLRENSTRAIWRYMPLLPVDPEIVRQVCYPPNAVTTVGGTPFYPAPRLAAALGLEHLWVKDDGRQPTASLKDRASAMAVVKARERGDDVITTASTGNAAAALSGLCAAIEQPNVIFVPQSAPEAKIAQLLAYGSQVLLVDGTYDQAFELCLKVARSFNWYNRNTAYNPYMSEGKKTVIYEVCEQLSLLGGEPQDSSRAWRAPDAVFVPVGDGCIIGGVHKGLRDLVALGWIDHMPRIFGVQAEGSNPLVVAWEDGLDPLEMEPVEAHSVADSIVAGLPRDRIKALRAVRESDGAYVSVRDNEILEAIPALAQGCGVFAEPAAAAAYAGVVKALDRGMIDADERVVVLSTGSGLKDVASAMKAVKAQPPIVEPTLADVQHALELSSIPGTHDVPRQ